MARQSRVAAARRGKNLTDDAIATVVRILDDWDGKLTWELLIEALVPRLHYRYTRQALHKHQRIRAAYTLRKESLKDSSDGSIQIATGELGECLARVARLEAENLRLEAENQRLLEQFVVWAYNAHTRGLSKDFLSQPLPRVNRGQTINSPRKAASAKKTQT